MTGKGRWAPRGFSLVELMVVMVLVGLASAVVVLTLPGGEADLDEEVRGFAANLDRLARESILSSRMLGVRIEGQGFQVYRLRRGTWEPLDGEDAQGAFHDGTLVTVGQGVVRAALLEDRSTARDEDDDTPPVVTPQIRFDPIGLTTPFWVRFERGSKRYVVRGEDDGTIEIVSEGIG